MAKPDMTFEDLKKELKEQCYFADDVRAFWIHRQDEIDKLPFKEMNELRNLAKLIIECDNYCV